MKRALTLNLAFVVSAAVAAAPWAPGELRMLGSALVVLVLPGVAWLGLVSRAPLTAARLALGTAGLSSLSAVLGLAIGAALTASPEPWIFLAWTWVAMNAGIFFAGPTPALQPGTPWRLLGGVALAGFLVTSVAALRLVPPLEDHDMEVRGTAYGLGVDGKPYFTSNREIYLPMSHPVLFNALVAQSLMATREIEAVRPSYDSAKKAEAAERAGDAFAWDAAWRHDYDDFIRRPALVGTRAPSALFAALVLALIVDALVRATGSAVAATAGAFVYMSVPETIVRSAYAGYFSETVFAMLAASLLLTEIDDESRAVWCGFAGAFMALIDHKTVVFTAAIAVWTLGVALARRERPERGASALILGFGGGTLAWWAYGFWVSPKVFIQDHLRKHFAHRFLMNDVRFTADHVHRYAPSIPELWREFLAHTGWVLVPVAVAAAVFALTRGDVLALWCLSGAVAFSLTDWRQTKHLMNGLAPMVVLAVAATWPWKGWKRFAAALLVAACLFNVWNDVALFRDFKSLHVSGASDVDGW
jgi:hypothetical protein